MLVIKDKGTVNRKEHKEPMDRDGSRGRFNFHAADLHKRIPIHSPSRYLKRKRGSYSPRLDTYRGETDDKNIRPCSR